MVKLRPARSVTASDEAVPHLEAASNRIPNRKPSWLDFRGCGEKIGFHVHMVGQCGAKRTLWPQTRTLDVMSRPRVAWAALFWDRREQWKLLPGACGAEVGLGKRELVEGEGGWPL